MSSGKHLLARRRGRRLAPGLIGIILTIGFPGGGLASQERDPWESARLDASRARLETIRSALEGELSSQEDQGARARRSAELAALRSRLEDGDFHPGDRIALAVVGESELTDTFSVARGPILSLPIVGAVPLSGVLASELNEHLTRSIGAVLRNPVVRARTLVQLSVLGEVARPGFYLVSPDAPLSEALMLAGGPTREAKIDELSIERGSARAGDALRAEPEGPLESRSANDLGLRTGDRIVVPGSGSVSLGSLARIGLLGLTAAVSLLQIFR